MDHYIKKPETLGGRLRRFLSGNRLIKRTLDDYFTYSRPVRLTLIFLIFLVVSSLGFAAQILIEGLGYTDMNNYYPFGLWIIGDLVLVSWGGTYGSVKASAEALRAQGKKVGHIHLRWLNPLPKNLGQALKGFKKVLVPEVNAGQLAIYLRSTFPGVDPLQYNRINGKAIKITDLVAKVTEILG